MKALNLALAVALFFSNTAFAQNSELDRLADASKSEVDAQARIAAQSDEALLAELLKVQNDLTLALRSQKNWKRARTATIVLTVGLATLVGVSAYKGNRSKDMSSAGIWIVGGVLGTVGTVGSAFGIGDAHYQVTIRTEEVAQLNVRLNVVKAELQRRLAQFRAD